jgi:hypothetical protein
MLDTESSLFPVHHCDPFKSEHVLLRANPNNQMYIGKYLFSLLQLPGMPKMKQIIDSICVNSDNFFFGLIHRLLHKIKIIFYQKWAEINRIRKTNQNFNLTPLFASYFVLLICISLVHPVMITHCFFIEQDHLQIIRVNSWKS